MRLRSFRGTPLSLAALTVSCAFASTSAEAQTSARVDDAGSRTATFAAKLGAARAGGTERGIHDAVRLTAADITALTAPLPTPYRSGSSREDSPGGFAMRLPGTGLELTNGSLSIHHTNDGRYARGVHLSVQLTY